MNERLAIALENLGVDGINALYVYLALDYGSLWIVIGLSTWGIRTVWSRVKNDIT